MRKRLLFLLFFVISFSYSQLVVNTEIDTVDAGDGLLSLREAVIEANNTEGPETIRFNADVFSAGANRIIFLQSALELTDEYGVIINGEDGKVTLDGSAIDSNAVDFKNGLVLKGGNNEISHIYMQKFLGSAILIDSANTGNNTVGPNNKISGCLGAGVMIIDSENNAVTGNDIWNCGFDSLVIDSNYTVYNQDGIMLLVDANFNTIEENNIWANYGSGIGAYSCGHNTITSNYIVINEGSGIQLLEDGGNNVIEANNLLGNEVSGIYLHLGSDNTISGNSIGDTLAVPQNYLAARVHAEIPGTAVRGTGDIIIQQERNRITDYGIMLLGTMNTDITENYVSGCDYYGIIIQGHQEIDNIGGVPDTTYHFPEGILIENNQLERNRMSSISIVNTLGATVRENYISFSSSGIMGQGLQSWSPEVVGRDSIERGDFVVENNIIFSIGGGLPADRFNLVRGGAILLGYLQSATVTNNEISKAVAAMYYSHITNLTVQENRVESIVSTGIDIQTVDNCLLEHNRFANIGNYGINISNNLQAFTSSADITGNILSGISYDAITCTTVTSLDVTGNTISGTGKFGIYLNGCNESNLEENEISGCTYNSIYALIANTVNINNNRITDPVGLMPYNSIELSGISSANITGNLISDARGHGIYAGESDTLLVTDNEIINSQNTGCFIGLAHFLQLENNELYGNQNGVYIESVDSILAQNNTLSRNNSSGMAVIFMGFCRVAGNFIFDNGGTGLNMDMTDSCVVESNYIALNNHGYMTSSPSGQLLRSNTIQGNKTYGAFCGALDDSLDARENYWGHANGPATSDTLYPGIAVGDRVNEMVLYQPFLTSPPVLLSIRPVISYLEPDQSPVEGGGSASLHGRQFMPGAQVYFGGDTVQQVQYISSDLLVLTIPPAANGYRDVIVVNPSGFADTLKNGFLYGEPSVLNEKESNLPLQYALYQNYPNPFNPSTTIRYDIVDKSFVELVIYNTLGQKVVTLVNKQQNPGSYSVDWNAGSYPSGIYFYLLRSEYFTKTQKLILIK